MSSELDRTVSDLLRAVARSEVLPRFRNLSQSDIREKKPGDLVTVADEASERAITEGLRTLDPEASVLGEEAVSADPELLEGLETMERAWIIDPVDGTANFSRGSETFAMMLACVEEGRTIASWIYDPVRDRMLHARRGEGVRIDGSRITPWSEQPERSEVAETVRPGMISVNYCPKPIRPAVQERLKSVPTTKSLWCAGQEYIRMVDGELAFSTYWRAMPWDHAPGSLIVNEMGGVTRHLDGEPYRCHGIWRGIMSARDKETWDNIADQVFLGLDVFPASA